MKTGKETVKFLVLYQALTKAARFPGKATTRHQLWPTD